MNGKPAALPPDLAAALAARPELGAAAVRYFPELASTNDTAAALAAAGAADGTVVLADRQTAGRGRRGRAWDSPSAAGLYLSVVLRGRQSPVITLLAGVAVAEAVQGTAGVAVDLKWPNDVVAPPAGGRSASLGPKVAGILTEVVPAESERDDATVIGIGVNVRTRAFPAALAGRAAALESLAGRRVAGFALCADLLVRLARWRRRLAAEGDAFVVARWRALAPSSRGAPVSWDAGGTCRRGVTAGVDDGGALLVSCGGRTERIVGGEVRWE
ncbi:MAG: biotin--[acetyl-CoA-carboxylase] ligase [Acidobacteria bacterium]|nr:biotin--[acetyl-CoA-carboxylase] ligase [Acidobacteriota bacterium]